VSRGYVPWLLLLAGLWGSSYFFIKVAVDDLEPSVMMSARCLVAGVLLLGFLVWTRGGTDAVSQLRAAGRPTFVFGLFNAALPFWLIAWGEKHIDSTVAGIAQATVPIFAFLVALRFLPHEHVAPIRWVGVGLGLVGVGVLTGVDLPGGRWAVAGTLAVVGSSIAYAGAGTYAQLRLRDVSGPVLATGGMLIGGLLLLPFALFQLPDAVPGWEAILSVAALAVVGTTFAQLVYFHMLPLYGNPRISLVAYIMPVFAIAYGALFLDESITGGMVIGLGLILGGVALGSGLVLASRRAKTVEEIL
jgi:drug/metabolite transporter (DMT)-like permease